tara:strand:+ start:613 stop:1212 length:600 start_codon:yes stop_codon:yes gene_type:complete
MVKKLLELFSGSGHLSNYFKNKGYRTTTLDLKNADIEIDFLEWNYKEFKPFYFDVIHAAPPCVSWSIARHHHRNLKEGLKPKTEVAIKGNKIINKLIEVINYFKPSVYFIENPRGRLRHYPLMKELPFRKTFYYIHYDYPISKPTDIWSNVYLGEDEKRNFRKYKQKISWSNFPKEKRSHYPPLFIKELFSIANTYLLL